MTAELATVLSMLIMGLGIVGYVEWKILVGIIIAVGISFLMAFIIYKIFKRMGLE